MPRSEIPFNLVRSVIFAGNAIITIESLKSGKWYTYKITRNKNNDNLYFIKNLRGPDNTQDYVYLGCVYKDNLHIHPSKTLVNVSYDNWPPSFQAIVYLIGHLNNMAVPIRVYHEGRCVRCGRRLTTPDSIQSGIGPECRKYL